MIKFIKLSKQEPYLLFKKKYDVAQMANQKNIEAVSISSFSKSLNEVNSRFVNLKFIKNKKFIFFSNYESPKSKDFNEHNQISALFFWNNTNTQIRIKGSIKKTSVDFNNNYFINITEEKNALAISSRQSKPESSYESVVDNYNNSIKYDNLKQCPSYWGGYSFIPHYFEFWEGHQSRLNKRDAYTLQDDVWIHATLQP